MVTNVSRRVAQFVVSVVIVMVAAGVPVGQQQQPPIPQPPQVPITPPPPPPPPVNNEKPAMSPPDPLYPTTPPELKQFVFENVYNYKRMRYQPPVTVQPVIRDRASYETPEQALHAHISAMLAGDFDWWLSEWDTASQAWIKERMTQLNRTPAFWREIWAKTFQAQVVLVERIDTGPFGPYVMLIYSIRDKGGKETLRSSFVTKYEAGRWVATQELAEDAFYHHYESGQDRVSFTVR